MKKEGYTFFLPCYLKAQEGEGSRRGFFGSEGLVCLGFQV